MSATLAAAVALAPLLAEGSPARAAAPEAPPTAREPEAPPPGAEAAPYTSYQGAYWGLQVHLGAVYRLHPGDGEAPGPLVGLSGRLAAIASLLDVQLTALGSTYTARPTARSHAGEAVDVARLSVGAEIHLHPLFLRHLEGSRLDLWLGGLYLSGGADCDVTALDGAGQARTEVDFGWHLGAGTDYPLTDPHRGWSLWLGVAYRLKFLFVSSGVPGLHDFSEHALLVTLGYRDNDIFGVRAPRPTELNYRDPPYPEGQ